MDKRVLVIVPTYSNAETLGNCLDSIRNQTHEAFEVAIICDGASAECQSVAKAMADLDSRFSVVLKPKSERRGEPYRHEVISGSSSQFVTYLCDDDLFLPNHLEQMLIDIEGYDFVNPLPAFVNREDRVWLMPTSIQNESSRRWQLSRVIRNSIGLSGVMHTRDAYFKLESGWETTPSKFPWTDLFMWRKFIASPTMQLRTSRKSTIIKFLGDSNAYDLQKLDQNSRWSQEIQKPGAVSTWNERVEEEKHKLLAELFVRSSSRLTTALLRRIRSFSSKILMKPRKP